MEDALKKLVEMLIEGGVKVIIALVVIGIGFWLTRVAIRILKKSTDSKKIDKSIEAFLASFISIGGKVLTILVSAATVGIPTTSLVTVLGSIGVAIGLALQGGLSNIAGGIMILIFKPFSVGDHIKCDTTEGVVNGLNLFYTELITFNNEKISLPNGTLSNSTIINYTSLPLRKVKINVSVSYKNDSEKVKNILSEVIDNEELVLQDKDKMIVIDDISDGKVSYMIKAWVNTQDYWTAYYNLLNSIKTSFDKNKIEVPFVTIKYTDNK